MFYGCSDITEFDFSNFDTSKVEYMGFMFCNCSSLSSLNLSTFNTTNVISMRNMFNGCSLLTSLNLSNFYTPNLIRNYQMFDGCSNLKYINMENFEETKIRNNTAEYKNIFDGVPDNIIICINENNTKSKIFSQLINKTIDCTDMWECKYYNNCQSKCQYYHYFNENNESICTENETCLGIYDKLIFDKNECVNTCEKYSIYKYEYNKICYDKCPNGTIYDENEKICFDEKNIYTTFITTEILKDYLNSIKSTFIDINFSYLINESNTIIPSGQINFSTTSFLDKIFNTTIFSNYSKDEIIENKINTSFMKIIQEPTFPQENISQSIMENLQSNYQINESQKLNFIIEGNNEKIYEKVINNIILNFDVNEEKEMIFQGEDDYFFHITNSQNELKNLKGNNNSNKFSIIVLGECENLLKKHYHINENDPLLILKFEKINNISTERSLQYEVYEPYNKTKLNLSICEDLTIDVYVPVILSEKTQKLFDELRDLGYDLFDINSPFYKDICTPYNSPDGTDVLLSDRVNYIYNNEGTSCQSNCKFSDYLIESQYMKCDCDIKNSEINIQKSKEFSADSIYKSFFNVLKYSNYKVLKCYKLVFKIKNLIHNIGSFFVIAFFLIYLIFLIIYFVKGISQIKNDIAKKLEENKNKKFSKNNGEKLKMNKNINNNKTIINRINYINDSKRKNKKQNNNIISKTRCNKNHHKKIIFTFPPKKNFKQKNIASYIEIKNKINVSINKFDKNILVTNRGNSLKSSDKINSMKENIDMNKQILDIVILNEKEREQLDNYEINNLEFDAAKKLDKRNFLEIYWSLLKREHMVIFTFISRDDHNIRFVKYAKFVFLLCSDMAINVFFFSDDTMHKMYLESGKYNFIQQIPQIIYSTIISQLIEIFLCYLSLTDKHYYQIKDCKNIKKNSLIGIIKCIKIKISFFFIFTSLMFIFYWYFIASFCSVYRNTQGAFIKDSILSFILGGIIPFAIYLIPASLRIITLKSNKLSLECVYKLSKIIPLF